MPPVCTIVDHDEDGNLPSTEDAQACGEEVLTPEDDPTIPPDHGSCPEHGLVPLAICTEEGGE